MKTAYFTMDVESFYDTDCIKNACYTVDENYSGIEGIKQYLDILKENNIKCTLFTLLSSYDDAKAYLKEAVTDGHEIALHGLDHKCPLYLTDDEFTSSIIEAKEKLENELNTSIIGYRAPCFGIRDSQIDILKEHGFKYDSSSLNFKKAVNSGKIDLSNYEQINNICYKKDGFFEITPNSVKTFIGRIPCSGGGYIRLFPWIFVKPYLKKCIKHTDCYMFYLHPYEMVNQKLPKIKHLKFIYRLFIKIGRRNYKKKIEYIIMLLNKYNFEFKTLNTLTKSQ